MSATLTGLVTPGVRAALRGQDPTHEQLAAITAPPGPIHVIAGAGSGKTAVMAARIVYLVERLGVAPASVLGLTFTNKAASELETRVREALADLPTDVGDEVTVNTYHAWAADLVKAYGIRVGVEVDADLLSEAQQYQILLGILDSERFEHLSVRTAGATIRKTLDLASACADHVVPAERVVQASRRLLQRADEGERLPDWMLQAAMERIELARLVERYAAEKRRRGRLDFGDQVAKAVELVEGHPELLQELRTRFQHVLLDEYQDTNVAQRRLMQQICPPGASIMAVGDARQAIYAFRGATMYNLLSFAEHFPAAGPAAPQPARHLESVPSPGTDRDSGTDPDPTLGRERPSEDPAGGRPAGWTVGAPLPLSTNFRSGPRILALANSVIDRIPEERRGGTSLVARPGAPDGEVRAALLADQFAEAAFVADQVVRAHEAGLPDGSLPEWRDVAVLVRSKRLLGPLREALEQRGVPVEVVGLSGLLETPEIVDLVSTLRVVADPGANVALARLLLGPRWRIGHRHLVRLARWASRHNWGLKDVLPGEDPDPGDVSFALAEALDHLDEVEGLDDEGRHRLDAFCEELRELRAAARGPLLDLVQTILERTGVWAELEASSDRRATTARQNLATFLDRVAAFAPVQGDPSLAAFLAYLEAVESASEPVEAVQPAPVDSVKLMTVHMAKGLEFPMVAVVGLSAGTGRDGSPRYGIFPDARVADPRRAQGFPYELREDASHLPRFAGNARAFRGELEERALEDERRLFYVALTRAKQLLVLTSAWWYQGSEKIPKGPGPFWTEAADHPAVDVLVRADQPAASPLTERLRARVSWPHPGRRPGDEDDPVFPEGLAAAVELERAAPGTLAARVPPGQADAFRAAAEAGRHLLAAARVDATSARVTPPRILSVTQVLTYARCPRDFYWSVVRPLPAAPKPEARLGIVVHRLLERRARSLPDLLDVDDLAGDRPAGHASPELIERATRSFASTRYANLPPPDAEVGVTLRVGPWVVRGRIDAIFQLPGSGAAGPADAIAGQEEPAVELVDWKTGRQLDQSAGGLDQLAVYALALRELGKLPGDHCIASYCYLGDDEPSTETRPLGPADLDQQRALLEAALAALERGDYQRACGLSECETCRRGVGPPPRLAADVPPATHRPLTPGADVGDRGFGDIRTRMRRALTAAMKARDRSAVTALRSALAAIDNAEVVDPANTPPATARRPGPGKAPPGDPPGEGRIAGAALGVGAAEVERRTLTPAETQAIVREEVTERQAAADAYERAGRSGPAERLRAEAEVLTAYLADADAEPHEPGD
ncbi:MAG TPA: UvrD-helicase domain-containing protein [Actinomycetes bacterium]|nr:UvrD-helicase domain-containing protein [Actinomycetes bacterium]